MFGMSPSPLVAVLLAANVQAEDTSLEPALNGAVSASGGYPTQLLEDRANAHLDWRLIAPYDALWGIAAAPREGGHDTDNGRPPHEPMAWPIGAD